MLKKNVGAADKLMRVILGIGLLNLLFVLDGSALWLGLMGSDRS